jgi:uncharacterized sulfatase
METRVAENDIDEIHERGITREDTWGGRITDHALEFIEDARGDDRPFSLVVSYDEPHEPSLCPPPFCDMYRDREYPLPDNYETVEELNSKPDRHQELAREYAEGTHIINSLENTERDGSIYRPLYFAASTFIDDEIGRVVDGIDAVHPNTVVTFTSDHGHYLGAHGIDLKHSSMYDEVTRVPIIVQGPSVAEGGVTDSLTGLVDLFPTYLDIAGAEVPAGLHGQSFLDTARDPSVNHRDEVLVEYHSYGDSDFYPVRCLVTDDGYKLVINLLDSDELYDLNVDPGELSNEIDNDEYADLRDDLHRTLLGMMEDTDDNFMDDAWADRAWSGGSD